MAKLDTFGLTELGYTIFLDRYAQKDPNRDNVSAGDIVVAIIKGNGKDTGQRREIAIVDAIFDEHDRKYVGITLAFNDEKLKIPLDFVDKPIEISPADVQKRIAAGVAAVENESVREKVQNDFEQAMAGFKFIPGGRIMAAAGTDQNLTYMNCFVLPSPKDSRSGIMKTLTDMAEIMSRGGGVGINISTLRPQRAYVKGVNGRSSGAISWGGLYSFVTGLIEQGGCLTPDTLVNTENGLLRMDEIVTHREKGWRDQSLSVMTDEGVKLSRQAYNNGMAETLRVNTDMGISLQGTPNHKVKVMTASGTEWKQLDELVSGDAILVKLGQHHGKLQALKQVTYKHHNQHEVTMPNILDEEFAFFLGYFIGDGFMTTKDGDWRIGVTVARDSYLINKMPKLMERIFPGVNVRTYPEDGCDTFVISNRAVKEFLHVNGLIKTSSPTASVPALIRKSPKEIVGAFLRGLFEADGGISNGYPVLGVTSKQLINEVSALLIGMGCPNRISEIKTNNSRYGTNRMWRVRIHSFRGLENWAQRIGCDEQSRFAVCLNFNPDLEREQSYRIPHAEYWVQPALDAIALPQIDHRATGVRIKTIDPKLQRKLHRYTRGERALTLSGYTNLAEKHLHFSANAKPINDTWFIFVDSVEKAGVAQTFDFEVDDNHTYIANGMVTHNSRRGALMIILDDWHPDIFEFINSKREAGKIINANISVNLSDAFMDAVKNDAEWRLIFPDTSSPEYDNVWDGDIKKWTDAGRPVIVHKIVKAREIWDAVIQSAWASAEPGIWFGDRANKLSNSYYYENGRLICTNPCITGDTRVYTNKGMIRAIDLYNNGKFDVTVDGRLSDATAQASTTGIFKTGTKPVYTLKTVDGYRIRVTDNHEIMTQRGWVKSKELIKGDLIHILNRPGQFGDQGDIEIGRVIGWLVGDGWISGKDATLGFVGSEKDELTDVFGEYVTDIVQQLNQSYGGVAVAPVAVPSRNHSMVSSTRLYRLMEEYGLVDNKLQVPEVVFRGTEDMQRGYLQALFTADGSVHDGKIRGVKLSSISSALLEDVQQLLINFGIKSRLYKNRRPAGWRQLPQNNGSGETKAYMCQASHELYISGENAIIFRNSIGFLTTNKTQRLNTALDKYQRGTYRNNFVARFESLEYDGEEDVYDLTEPITHSFIANGIVVHNCAEQPLSGNAACNLGSINLATMYNEETQGVNWDLLRETTAIAVRFLDNIIDATPYPLPQNKNQQLQERRVGLGVMGLAELLVKCKVRYGSDDGVALIEEIYKAIATEAYFTSADLAYEKGPFERYSSEYMDSGFVRKLPDEVRDYIRTRGMRNVTLITQAPTGSTGTLVNTSTGIEPFFSWVFYRKGRLGIFEERVEVVQKWLAENPGKTESDLPEYFVTAMELSPEEHVRAMAVAQKWVDSSISKTCNVPNSYTTEQVGELYRLMYDLGCKGGTIYRDGSRDEQVLNLTREQAEKGNVVETAVNEDIKTSDAEDIPVTSVNPEPAALVTDTITKTFYSATNKTTKKRPVELRGFTYKFKTEWGGLFVTINEEGGTPYEVFVTVGKSGSDLQATAESMGRLMSMLLRRAEPGERMHVLADIVSQMRHIGGGQVSGFGPNRVTSLPDAVAKVIEEQYIDKPKLTSGADITADTSGTGGFKVVDFKYIVTPDSPIIGDPVDTISSGTNTTAWVSKPKSTLHNASTCPECNNLSLVREEGCSKCKICGYSRC